MSTERNTPRLRNALLAVFAALSAATSAHAYVIITYDYQPTVDLPGYTTWTLTANTDNGSQIQGFDFASRPEYGFFGSMNQVNPAGISTIFQDANAFFSFVGADVSQDSQFLFNSGQVTVPAGHASESSTELRAVFAAPAPLGTSVPFVQLVTPDASPYFTFTGQIQTVVGGSVSDHNVSGSRPFNCLDCEPHPYASTIDDVIANDPGMVMAMFSAVNPADAWHDFMFQSYTPGFGGSGSGPAAPATFDPDTQKFSWTTIGSAPGTYVWQVSATNFYGTDSGSITVRIVAVPEPATRSLLSLVVIGGFGLIRRLPT